jgi:hypothetical protein
MAIRRKDRPQYLAELNEIRQNTFFGYADRVVDNCRKSGREVNRKVVYRVISGQLKDQFILDKIKTVLAEEI